MNLYETLGIDKSASKSEIKKAYRDLAAKHHPDVGGKEEIFKKISAAHDILKDEISRSHYDDTGEDKKKELNFEQLAAAFIQAQIIPAIEQIDNVDNCDMLELFNKIISTMLMDCTKALDDLESDTEDIVKLESIINRMKIKDGASNIFTQILTAEVISRRKNVAMLKDQWQTEKGFMEQLQEVLKSYEYEYEQMRQIMSNMGGTGGSSSYGSGW